MTRQADTLHGDSVVQGYQYIRVSFDGLNMLLLDNHSHPVEPARALSVDARTRYSVGRMATDKGNLVAYCLNSRLQLLNEMPLSRRVSIILPVNDDLIAIMCERAERIEFGTIPKLSPVPECMRNGYTPVSHLSIHDGKADIVVHSPDLVDHIHRLITDDAGDTAVRQTG